MENKYYTIKNTSKEGIYYLVNGWNKNKKFWIQPEKMKKNMFFKRPGDAKTSLTKLLKIMEEYKSDTFELIEIKESEIS